MVTHLFVLDLLFAILTFSLFYHFQETLLLWMGSNHTCDNGLFQNCRNQRSWPCTLVTTLGRMLRRSTPRHPSVHTHRPGNSHATKFKVIHATKFKVIYATKFKVIYATKFKVICIVNTLSQGSARFAEMWAPQRVEFERQLQCKSVNTISAKRAHP